MKKGTKLDRPPRRPVAVRLPAGRYCLISGVVWQAGYRMTGATVGAVVDVRDGETARAIMTR